MKSVYNATDLPLVEKYDYIVIGGGTSGCPLAATLSEKYSVLVLERGNVPNAHPDTLVASGIFTNLVEEDDGTTPAQRFTSKDGVENVRGRVLGGSSMINAAFYSEADEDFLAMSGVDWDMEEVEKAYEWVRKSLVSYSNLSVWQIAAKDAFVEAGIGPDNGITLEHKVGVKQSDPSAIGVMYTDSKGKSHKALIRNKGEVIVSAGALGSPQLLLLSGIGPKSYLSSQNISIVLSQPNVGKFMADNPRNSLNLIIPFPLDASTSGQLVAITKDYYIETNSYTMPFSPTMLPFGFYPNPLSPPQLTLAVFAEKVVGPLSMGALWLASATDVKVTPHVKFNYFSNSVDLARCVSATKKFGELLKTKSMDQFKYTDLNGVRDFMFLGPLLPTNQSNDSSIEDYCRSFVTTFWHYHGGCLVGKVVDGEFKVIGTNSLRVVDGSTFNMSPGTNPQATVMMIGRWIVVDGAGKDGNSGCAVLMVDDQIHNRSLRTELVSGRDSL
ncbi:hypothetical protein G4B88_005112 [Cannabis sativa]|uniref:(R)-mandelonitrile lyase n=1 Tax=Cannabis sativa TaxID=3483 RepID=A0A7J6H4N6_CANSA|nr:hypothetical protein G4B88_005112 [Cannabis sativa]